MTMQINTQRDAKFATDHELANEFRKAKENRKTRQRNLIVSEALDRGISKEQLKEIR